MITKVSCFFFAVMEKLPRGKRLALLATNVGGFLNKKSQLPHHKKRPTNHKKRPTNEEVENENLKLYLKMQKVTDLYFLTTDIDISVVGNLRDFMFPEEFIKTFLEEVLNNVFEIGDSTFPDEVSEWVRTFLDEVLNNVFEIVELNIMDIEIVDENLIPLSLDLFGEDLNESEVAEDDILVLNILADRTNNETVEGSSNSQETATTSKSVMEDKADMFAIVDSSFTKSGNLRKRKIYKKCKIERSQYKLKVKKLFHAVKPSCNGKTCLRKCSEAFFEEERKMLNQQFWEYNFKERKVYVATHIQTGTAKHRKPEELIRKKKERSLKYFLKKNGTLHSVCKKFFLATLGFSHNNDSIIKTALKTNQGDSGTARSSINSNRRKKIDREIIENHIKSFSPAISHYRRQHAPNRLYLPSDLTIRDMHENFTTAHPNVPVSYEVYRKIVSKDMNISFTKLGNEECEKCESFELHNENHRKETADQNVDCDTCKEWTLHLNKANITRRNYRIDADKKPSEDEIYYSADMQKVIMLPRLEMFKQVLFTPRLIAFNESFVPLGDIKHNLPFVALWHEEISGRKKEDVVSTFYNFFLFARDYKKVTIWLDNCSAQNKNWCLYSFLIFIINSDEISTDTITLKYLEAGHTFMSADNLHRQIENNLRHNPKVYDFTDFVNAVRKCNGGKIICKEMKHFDFRKWPDWVSLYQLNKASSSNRPLLKDMSVVIARRGSRVLYYKTDFDGAEQELQFLMKKYLKGPLPKPEAYIKNRGISAQRKTTILRTLGSLMPPHKLLFWEELSVGDDNIPETMRESDVNETF